ncbi:lysylphosphatidylglycerol synthase transmembrane domain-containing protein [Microcella sp.]|uniref:lysylphosphatidylglycerol synthase transmembrane domain-containing protein n=1 Tax=Microcella sp. TaxID=1913979 RepID=UPI00299F851D|nr:lysylphosphatidylglycerol synthase transmembrane domain-containing protein [Microcella sp.]MDX2026769.1 lysylphosphatidylglycerol synthase transmembrane domain-containing protein [Microcella sp.]
MATSSIGRRALIVGAQALVTVGLLVLLWQVADGRDAAAVLLGVNPWWLAVALVALTVHTVLAAERWRLTAGALGLPLGRWHALREYYLAQLVNSTVPGGVVGDAGRAVRSREQAGLTVAAQAVVVERFAGQVALLATMTIAVTVTALAPGGLEWSGWMLRLAATITLVSLAVVGVLLAARWLPGRVGPRMAELSRTAAIALVGRRVVLAQLALSAGTTACILIAFWASAAAVGLSLSFAAVVTLVPLILLTMLVPITISGWGLREGAAAALLPLAGATASASLAASVVFGLVGLAAVLPGLLVVWVRPAAAGEG